MDDKTILLRRIAVLCVEGRSWTEIAQELKQTPEAVRTLVWENEEVYQPFLRRARREFLSACCLDAVRALQLQLKSKEEKIRNSAANCLMRFWMARMRYQETRRMVQQKAQSASLPAKQPTEKAQSLPNSAPSTPKPIPPVNAPTPPPPAKKPFSGPTISSDEVLKWLNEKKVGV